jgi:DNA-binding response OmpR family regulator
MIILLAEDDTFFQNFYALKLREQGFTVDIASNGEEAITKLSTQSYDLLLLDIIMPKKNGFEVLSFLKERGVISRIPIIVFSTLGQNKTLIRLLNCGAADYVNKTFFDFDKLLSKINVITQKNQVPI